MAVEVRLKLAHGEVQGTGKEVDGTAEAQGTGARRGDDEVLRADVEAGEAVRVRASGTEGRPVRIGEVDRAVRHGSPVGVGEPLDGDVAPVRGVGRVAPEVRGGEAAGPP